MRPKIAINVHAPADAEAADAEEAVASFEVTEPLGLQPYRFDMNMQELALVVLDWLTLRNGVELKLSKLPGDVAQVIFRIGPHSSYKAGTPIGPDELAARFHVGTSTGTGPAIARFELPVQKIAAGILAYFTARSHAEREGWAERKRQQEVRAGAATGRAIINPEGRL